MSTQVHATSAPNNFAVGGVESPECHRMVAESGQRRHADVDPQRRSNTYSRSSARSDCNSISSARRNGWHGKNVMSYGSSPALGNPLHILSHSRAMMIETILLLTERTMAKRRELEAMSDEELNAEYREVTEL
jgi:hypothetical protein